MATTRETIKHLVHLFSSASSSSSNSTPPFPSLSLSPSTSALLDSHLSQFAASFPLGGGGGHHRDTEGERERVKWREGLLEIWNIVEPLPGTEGDAQVIAGVSAFLVLLDKLSAGVGDDDDSALVSRKDVAQVWWGAVLRRTVLGTPKESAPVDKGRGRKPATVKKGKEVVGPTSSSLRPLTVSREAMAAVSRMVVWGTAHGIGDGGDVSDDAMTPFGLTVLGEYEKRAIVMLRGVDERYGVRNLEECVIGWGERSPKAFFLYISPFIDPTAPLRLPFLSLLLAFLSRHSAKAYHALPTPLLGKLTTVGLLSPSPVAVALAIKCLAIFLVTLPVIIGDALPGIMAVYGRVVSWEKVGDAGETVDLPGDQGSEDSPSNEDAFEGPPPNPLGLFTVLYGIYPCNFTAFLTDPVSYLRSKDWKGARGDGDINLDSAVIKDRSKPLIRRHSLHPSLISSDLATELTDTNRWRRLESADVMAECDRNVVQQAHELGDYRGQLAPHDDTATDDGYQGRSRVVRDFGSENEEEEDRRTATPVAGSMSRSRSPTPHMPTTTHFANFQALQSTSLPSSRPSSPFRTASRSPFTPRPPPIQTDSTTSSRRSSFLGSPTLLSPDSGMSRSNSQHVVPGDRTPNNKLVIKLEARLALLQAEVNFQTYLKQLHLAHMGTLHREKVLESGAEAERQSLYRTIRTLRAQLKQTKSSLEQLRGESSVTKTNWIAHIDDLKEKLKTLREQRREWDREGATLKVEVEELKGVNVKQGKELEGLGAAHFDLMNQVTLDAAKLARVEEYEGRIAALTKTLAICDEDLCKFADQRREMEQLAGRWKKAELLREASEAEVERVKETLRTKEDELVRARNAGGASTALMPVVPALTDAELMRKELERLRERVEVLEEENAELREVA